MPMLPQYRFLYAGPHRASWLVYLLLFLLQGCSMPACAQLRVAQAGSAAPSHAAWDGLLKKWVDERGMVDYKGFASDRKALRAYLQQLEASAPDPERWSREEQLAYWLNAYNAFTIELILRHYPLESIKDIKAGPQIPFVNTPWDIKFIRIGGRELDLNNIEHNIIRPGFEEPRIHFALVCAARSCPKLRREAYVADRLEGQLAEQARSFLLDPDKNIVRSDRLQLSKLFDWYGGDFTKGRSLQEAIREYSGVPVSKDAPIRYLYYNWQLNEQ
ncbi:DUF547 domain-containing protein [Cesiribacter andamanensis]|uniref:DUF547 domain-containing protein n=1 Tax=Cesiribacter andamanensis AMV16 TaxID=1279009 RepID=M7N6J7_9BACT|nr:DUF547 domain-containing protein [Cesiribacter andamanensis]EMR04233.1 hypothetical protein ADICEAN_00641 [Cesiribacter andamanensis AMV16]